MDGLLLPATCRLQARILALNASYFLENGGHVAVSINANSINPWFQQRQSLHKSEETEARPVQAAEQVRLEHFERDHACVLVVTEYRIVLKTAKPVA
ncbi:hypothetical protein C5167_024175 [Papaver somniferum]|uniref:Uncharacterized protein n=1 Tax=Papaver somniferum TaxID=3469 RepID=A0A4Y7JNV9_PAPSO|nr:hypothetical protein C5167_024175 [Papaver somniferum]